MHRLRHIHRPSLSETVQSNIINHLEYVHKRDRQRCLETHTALSKLWGLGTFRWPARAAKPEHTTNSRITTLKTPRTSKRRIPVLGKVAWMTTAKVTQAIAIPRACHPSASPLPAARSTYLPKARELLEEKPSKIICVRKTEVARYFGCRYTLSR